MNSTYLLSPIGLAVEKAKIYAEGTEISADQRLNLQSLLSAIRTEANLLEKRILECEIRQNVYAEMAEKILDRAIRKDY